MSAWRHVLCRACYAARHPGRAPHVVVDDADAAPCCGCGGPSASIYVRGDPAELACGGRCDA